MFAKKSLGQNFLKSESAIRATIDAGRIKPGDFVLEIGPGQGALTEKILEAGANVLAVEKDSELISLLEEKFIQEINFEKLRIVEEDILSFDPRDMKKPYKIIANIPYYITGAIIRIFLETRNQPELMVLLVQKEVADRIVSRDKKGSLLAMAVASYCEPKILKKVPAGSFAPAPKVDSAIVIFDKISKNFFIKNKIDEKNFFKVLRAGFAHKRKVLRKNLEPIMKDLGRDKSEILEIFSKNNLGESVRPEELSLPDWAKLTKEFFGPTVL